MKWIILCLMLYRFMKLLKCDIMSCDLLKINVILDYIVLSRLMSLPLRMFHEYT